MSHTVIVGLGFGDEGKGAAVDWLCAARDIKAVIRYNGGSQAAHNVVQPDGRHHTFAQFGSGTFHGVPTHLSEYMMVNPLNMVKEADHLVELGLPDPFAITTVSEDALLITDLHRVGNRIREDLRGADRHGSTGQGIGETREFSILFPNDAPRVRDLRNRHELPRKLVELYTYYLAKFGNTFRDQVPPLDDLLAALYGAGIGMNIVPSEYVNTLLDSGDCVFEGAQGVLLDEDFGFHPHTTWSRTTTQNALELLNGREAETIGLTRTYHTRHGAGPFPTENYETDTLFLPEPHNGSGTYQGEWRTGAFDLTLLNYARRAVGSINTIMVSHMDVLSQGVMATYGYEDYTMGNVVPMALEKISLPTSRDEQRYVTEFLDGKHHYLVPRQYDIIENQEDVSDAIEMATGIRPTIFSYGPTWKDKKVANFSSVS